MLTKKVGKIPNTTKKKEKEKKRKKEERKKIKFSQSVVFVRIIPIVL